MENFVNQANLVTYDSFNFGQNGIILTDINHLSLATRDNQLENRADRGGAVLVQSQLGTKSIQLTGYYVGSDAYDAQRMYDVLASVLNRQQRPLVIPHAGKDRRYIATPQNIIIQQPDGLNRLTFDFEFVVPDGHSLEQLDEVLVNQTTTQPTTTIPLNVLGSVAARPRIVISFGNITGGAAKTVTLRNARDYVGITIQRNFSSNDTIIIDSANFQMYINGVLTHPNGRLPVWQAGAGALYYADTFTSRSVHIQGTYKPGNL